MTLNQHWLCALCTLFIFGSINAQKTLVIEPSEINEILYDKTPVSGEIQVGILGDYNDQNIVSGSFFTRLPKMEAIETEKDLVLCTTISSRDGLYRANITKPLMPNVISKTNPSPYTLTWEPDYPEKLNSYKKKDVAILSMIAESCEADPICYVLTSWSENDTNTFTVLLNSLKLPRIIVKTGDIEKPCECEKIDDISVAYNYKCELPAECSEESTFKIQTKVTRLGNSTIKTTLFPIKYCK